jgi:hypothetical protein
MKECIEEINTRFLSGPEIDEMGKKIFLMMKESDERKKNIEDFKKEGELEEEEV